MPVNSWTGERYQQAVFCSPSGTVSITDSPEDYKHWTLQLSWKDALLVPSFSPSSLPLSIFPVHSLKGEAADLSHIKSPSWRLLCSSLFRDTSWARERDGHFFFFFFLVSAGAVWWFSGIHSLKKIFLFGFVLRPHPRHIMCPMHVSPGPAGRQCGSPKTMTWERTGKNRVHLSKRVILPGELRKRATLQWHLRELIHNHLPDWGKRW